MEEKSQLAQNEQFSILHNFSNYLLSVPAFVDYSPFPLRFVVKIHFKSSGCWQWTGAAGFHPSYRHHRYGQFVKWNPDAPKGKRRTMTSAHRFAYECVHGPIAPELDVDHLCGNKLCVNPDHLEAVPHRENIKRMYRRRIAR